MPRPPSSVCLGGCGVTVAPGQKCVACATAAVAAWVAKKRAAALAPKAPPKRQAKSKKTA